MVETPSSTVTTTDGIVDVEQVGPEGRVQVLAGAADVGGPGERASPLALGAGEAMTTDPGGVDRKVSVTPAPDWTRGMLQFDGTPLAEAVALANRYSERRILLVGDLGRLRVTGAFRTGDTAGLARALAAAFGLSLQQNGEGNLVLSRKMFPERRNKIGG